MNTMRHYALDCRMRRPLERHDLQEWLELTPSRLGLTRISPAIIHWAPPIVSGMCVLAESHLAVHADLARQWFNLDVFVCAGVPDDAMAEQLARLGLSVARMVVVDRGPVPNDIINLRRSA